MSWAEQMELEEQMAEAEATRYPGRAIHLHEKLSSPARKKEPHETFRYVLKLFQPTLTSILLKCTCLKYILYN